MNDPSTSLIGFNILLVFITVLGGLGALLGAFMMGLFLAERNANQLVIDEYRIQISRLRKKESVEWSTVTELHVRYVGQVSQRDPTIFERLSPPGERGTVTVQWITEKVAGMNFSNMGYQATEALVTFIRKLKQVNPEIVDGKRHARRERAWFFMFNQENSLA